ncbi:MAG: hypothetical protein ACK417_03235 [Bacteroidia bacterium]
MKKLLLFTLLALGFSAHQASAQLWYSFALRGGYGTTVPYVNDPSTWLISYEFGSDLDFTLTNFDDDLGLSLSAAPGFGRGIALNMNRANLFTFNSPITVQLKYGAFASQETAKEHGVAFGVGVNPHYFLNLERTNENPNDHGALFILQPVVRLSYNSWSSSNFMRSISIMATFGPTEQINGITSSRSGVFVSYARYFNY